MQSLPLLTSKPPAEPDALLHQAIEEAIGGGDWPSAFGDLELLASRDPLDRETWRLLERIQEMVGDPLELVPQHPGMSPGRAVLRGWFLARRGDFGDALILIEAAVKAGFSGEVLEWLRPWLVDGRVSDSFREIILNLYATVSVQLYPDLLAPPEVRTRLEGWLPELRRWQAMLPNDAQRLYLLYAILRKAGKLDEALLQAQRLGALASPYSAAVARSLVHLAKWERDEWFAACQDALAAKPDDTGVQLDLGDRLWLSFGDAAAAAPYYEAVLQRDPEHPWAKPSWFALNLERSGDLEWREALEAHAAEHPDSFRANDLLDRLSPLIGYLPEPTDAVINLLRRMVDPVSGRLPANLPDPFEVEVSHLEAPSALLAVQRQLRRDGEPQHRLVTSVGRISTPDPREAIHEVQFAVWHYQGEDAYPVVGKSLPDWEGMIATLAQRDYHLASWSREAERLALRMAPLEPSLVLGLMVHPPKAPSSMWEWDWLFRVQTASALVLAHADLGWHGSLRRQVLLDLLYGVSDWTIIAAGVALTAIAREEPEALPEIEEAFHTRLRHLPRPGYVCWVEAIVACGLRLPTHANADREEWRQLRRALWQLGQKAPETP